MDTRGPQKAQLHATAAPFRPGSGSGRLAAALPAEDTPSLLQGRSCNPIPQRKGSRNEHVVQSSPRNVPMYVPSRAHPHERRKKGGTGRDEPGEDRVRQRPQRSYKAKALTHYTPLPFSRERFVQANFMFCVNSEGSYEDNMRHADSLINWDMVELAVVRITNEEEQSQCSICLDQCKAPRMTACGHVFCYLCILRYFSYTTRDRVCRCPLCADRICLTILKPVAFETILRCEEGLTQSFRLLARPRNSVILEELDESREDPKGEMVTFKPIRTNYARFCYTNEEHMIGHLERDSDEVAMAIAEAEDVELMKVFAEMAQSSIRATKAEMKRRLRRKRYLMHHGIAATSATDRTADDVCSLASRTGPEAEHAIKYIYQAENGANIYLHPFNVKCLTTEYINFRDFPLKLSAEVVAIEKHVMSEELRKRYRILSHVPIGCEFTLCELDLSTVLDAATQEVHAVELTERREARARQKRSEKREEKKRRHQKKDEVFHEYDRLHRALLSSPLPRAMESLDINDVASFPNLSSQADAGDQGSEAGTRSPSAPVNDSPTPEVTSYASITRQMGFFPGLESSPSSAPLHDEEEFPLIGSSSRPAEASSSSWGSAAEPRGAWSAAAKSKKKKSKTIMST